MRLLAPPKYLSRNVGKTAPLVGVIVLAVMLIGGIVSLMNSIPLSVRTIYKYSSKMMGVTPRGDANLTPKLRQAIEKESPVKLGRICTVRASDLDVRSIVGKWAFAAIGLNTQDFPFVLERLECTKLEGRIPKAGAPEVVISEPVARNLGLKLGDVLLKPDNPEAYSPMPVKIVGIAQSKLWLVLCDFDYYVLHHFPPIDILLVFAEDPKMQPQLDAWAFERFKGERARVFVYSQAEKDSQSMFETLYKILDVVVGTLVTVITIMMSMLINIHLGQRTQEFGLLQALGYTKRQLMGRVVSETLIVVIGGWLLGLALAVGLLHIVDRILMHPNAYALEIYDMAAFRYTLPVPIAILAAALGTLWNRFRTFDPIGVLERRLV